MMQINQQFVIRHLIPLMQGKILKDMQEGKNNPYLRKLQIGEVFNPIEKRDFFLDYFAPTTEFGQLFKEDIFGLDEFKEQFLKHFSKLLKNRMYLSGQNGVAKAYFTKEDKSNSSEVQRNIFRLAYFMMLDFEKDKTEKLIDAKAANTPNGLLDTECQKYKKLLAEGKLRLVKQPDGTQAYYSQEDFAQLASRNPGTTVTPYIQQGLGEQLGVGNAGSDGQFLFGDAGATVGDTANGAATVGNLQKDFNSSQIASLESDLEKNGLEVVKPLKPVEVDKDGNRATAETSDNHTAFKGSVKDVDGKELIVIVDPRQGYDSAKKITFIFADDQRPEDQKQKFCKSQQDLKDFKEPDKNGKPGRRKPAIEVLLEKVGERFEAPFKPLAEPPNKKADTETYSLETAGQTVAPNINHLRRQPKQHLAPINTRTVLAGSRISQAQQTVMQAKKAVQQARQSGQPQITGYKPGAPAQSPQPNRLAQQGPEQPQQQPKQKKKMSPGMKYALAAGSTAALPAAAATAGALASPPETADAAIYISKIFYLTPTDLIHNVHQLLINDNIHIVAKVIKCISHICLS